MKYIRTLLAVIVLLLAIPACNLPGGAQSISLNDQAATLIAATLQAGNENGADVPITATFSSTPEPTTDAATTITATSGPTATITPTYSVPMLTLLEQTNCRTGPGLNYEVQFAVVRGARREIIGHYPQENYWLIKMPESRTGECWVWGEYAEASGSYWVVPSVTPPPTATLVPPVAPSIDRWDFFCNTANGNMSITILWTDNTNNETAFIVYRNGQAIGQLAPDSESFTETIAIQAGDNIRYQIEVISPSGAALSAVVSVTC